ncbi:MAG: hypothetical protein ACXWR1_06360 [Bdellovibrionota bacterium]
MVRMPAVNDPAESLLVPSFEKAFWRSRQRIRFRDCEGFAKKKGHFEPEEHNAYAGRWAEELTREESAAEVRQVYENSVVILGNRRSAMERSERLLDCAQFRFSVEAMQDPEEASFILISRQLWVKTPLNELPEHFDDLFPYRPEELVVPIQGTLERKAILLSLEDWEHTLKAKLSENADQSFYRLRLPSGFSLSVDLSNRETIFSEEGISGVTALGPSVARDLKKLRIQKRLL